MTNPPEFYLLVLMYVGSCLFFLAVGWLVRDIRRCDKSIHQQIEEDRYP